MNTYSSEPVLTENKSAVIEAELDRLLADKRFSGAPQMSAFLRYIVTETLKGNGDRIKAYSVGVDALGKPASFDAQSDPSVRVLALRLRKTLTAVYQNGSKPFAIVDLRVGTYVPEFFKPDSRIDRIRDSSAIPLVSVGKGFSATKATGQPTTSANETPEKAINSDSQRAVETDSIPAGQPVIRAAEDITSGRLTAGSVMSGESFNEPSLDKSGSNKWWALGVAMLAIAGWKVVQPTPDVEIAQAASTPLAVLTATMTGEVEFVIPTLYLPHNSSTPELEQRLVTMLSSSMVRAGTLHVVMATDTDDARQYSAGEYTLLIDGFDVGENFHVEAQVVNLRDGQLLFAASLLLEQPTRNFSAEVMGEIEVLAQGLADVQGPLYKDYCVKHGDSGQVDCAIFGNAVAI